MKKHIKLLTIGTLLLGGLTGCNDFLDREPLDKVIPEKYFASESDLAAYTINAYPFETVTDAYGINFFGKDNDTDNQASGDSPAFWIPGQKKVPSGEGEWDWSKIRTCNYFFDDTPEGMNASLVSINPYYTMFCDENMEGYDEILMWKLFKEGLVTSNLQMELARNGGGSGWTRGMVNSFLMRNGLPIYAAGSDYNPDWEKEGVNSTLQNRDSRIVIFTKKPGDANTENKGDVNYYGDDGTPSYCSIRFIYGDKGSLATTGFIIKKGKHYSSHMANDHSAGTSGGIVFRAAEAMLIYMEASYEKNGRIDGTADGYWKALRRRAKVDEDYNKTIAATQMSEEAKGDFGAYSHGQLIDATLYNIRRERRNELCAEALRWEDLKRWRACDQLISKPYRVEGMLYWGSNYETQLADLCKVDPAEGNMSSPDLSKYILPYEKITKNNLIAGQKGFLFTPAHYLNPIGMAVFRQTASDKNDFTSSVVYQNPGWKIEGDTGAQPVE